MNRYIYDLQVNEQTRRDLRRERMASAALYMLQRRSGEDVCQHISSAGVPYALFKGIALRERLFDTPSARPADDIDVLVPSELRNEAIIALVNTGYSFKGKAETISHEAMLQDGHVAVDLHWRLFRPGRSRIELAPILIQKTRTDGPFTVLDDDASLLVMLVHPAFTKQVNGPLSKLIRAVELDRMLRRKEPDWDWLLKTIDAAGIRAAAWSDLHWIRSLMGTPIDTSILDRLAPGNLHGRYLASWIDHGLPDRLDGIPGIVQFAFTLALHDRLTDAVRATVYLAKSRLDASPTLTEIANATPGR